MKPLTNKPSFFPPFWSSSTSYSSSSAFILVLVALVCTLGVTGSFSWSWRVNTVLGTGYSSSLAFSTKSRPNSQVVNEEAAPEAHPIVSPSNDSEPNGTVHLPHSQIVSLCLQFSMSIQPRNFNIFLQVPMY